MHLQGAGGTNGSPAWWQGLQLQCSCTALHCRAANSLAALLCHGLRNVLPWKTLARALLTWGPLGCMAWSNCTQAAHWLLLLMISQKLSCNCPFSGLWNDELCNALANKPGALALLKCWLARVGSTAAGV